MALNRIHELTKIGIKTKFGCVLIKRLIFCCCCCFKTYGSQLCAIAHLGDI